MKSKRALAVICALFIALLVPGLAGCGLFGNAKEGNGEHEHTVLETVWEKDATGHWHSCSSCGEKVDFSSHKYSSPKSTLCSVCNWMRVIVPDEEQGGSGSSGSSSGGSGEGGSGGSGESGTTEKPITDEYITENASSSYGYDWLGRQTGGTDLQAFYARIDAAADKVWDGTAQLSVETAQDSSFYSAGKLESKTLTIPQIKSVYQAYCYDHPYNFWQDQTMLTGYTTIGSDTTNYVYLLVLSEYRQHDKIASDRAVINDNVRKLYAEAADADSDYERALAYYRAIALKNDYTYGSDSKPANAYWAHGIVGILDDVAATGPVCEGYARTFQLMLNLRGVENAYCVGKSAAAGAGGGGGHAWNMVKLDDGKWYYFDLTWDDGDDGDDGVGGSVRYNYFAMSAADKYDDKAFTGTHFAGSPENANGYFLYDLPEAAATSYAGTEFLAGGRYAAAEMEYVRNGLRTVGVRKFITTAATVTVPQTVEIGGKTYTVNELGPNLDGNTLKSIATTSTKTVVVPESITYIHNAAFYCGWKIDVHYRGTSAQWSKIKLGSNNTAIDGHVYYNGEW